MSDLWMDVDAALSEVPINLLPLIDDTDFKTREESVVYNQSGLDLVWNFVTTAGAMTQTAVTPTDTGGAHDWVSQGNGLYTIEIPASSGTINNDTEGFGWFTGFATGVLPWRGPVIGFRAAALNNSLIDGTKIAVNVTEWSGSAAGTLMTEADVNTQADLALSDIGLNNLSNTSPGSTEPADGTYLDQIMHKAVGQTFDPVTDSLEAIRDKNDALLTTSMTEAYASDGSAPTSEEMLFMIWSRLAHLTIDSSGTVLSTKKLDGSTEAMSFSLDTTPSASTKSIKRSL